MGYQIVTDILPRHERAVKKPRAANSSLTFGSCAEQQTATIVRHCRGRVPRPGGNMWHLRIVVGESVDDRFRDGKPVPYDPII